MLFEWGVVDTALFRFTSDSYTRLRTWSLLLPHRGMSECFRPKCGPILLNQCDLMHMSRFEMHMEMCRTYDNLHQCVIFSVRVQVEELGSNSAFLLVNVKLKFI